jgi:hypothetical protein
VTLGGFTNRDCSTCSEANDTFILDQWGPDPCVWMYTGTLSCGSAIRVKLFVQSVGLNTRLYAEAEFNNHPGGEFVSWYSDSASLNCLGVSGLSLPLQSPGYFLYACYGSSATCTVTAIP